MLVILKILEFTPLFLGDITLNKKGDDHTNKDEIDASKPIVAMICATVMGSIALFLGIDGLVLASVVGIVASLGGYTLKSKTG